MMVKSMRLFEPMLPDTTTSVFRPMPMSTGRLPWPARTWFHSRKRLIMATAVRTARSSSSSWATGMPKAAMMASPMNLSSIPPSRWMQSTMISKYSLSRLTVACGPSSSVSVVKPRMSENSTVAVTLRPPSNSAPEASTWSAIEGSM